MSGGVDSTCTAIMLKEKYNVTGFFMQLAQPDLPQQIEQVSRIAERLDIPLKIIDLNNYFDDEVLSYFCSTYFNGLTPNPCIICNQRIKFGLFLNRMLDAGMTKVATGHYARIEKDGNSYQLLKGIDMNKDQSYFLSRLDQSQLAKVLFPLGNLTKVEIYDFAQRHGFHGFKGKESQDVCFLADTSVADFLKSNLPNAAQSGDIVDTEGRILGSHSGIFNYTIGQRRGLGIPDASPYYVIALDPQENRVIIGKEKDLFADKITIDHCHWISGNPPIPESEYQVKIRYTHRGDQARLKRISDTSYRIKFNRPQKAITPGQYSVIYDGDEVIGSGEIVGSMVG